jgi:hypothetical protein
LQNHYDRKLFLIFKIHINNLKLHVSVFHLWLTTNKLKKPVGNHLGDGPVVKAWDQEVCSLCGLRFEPCGCSYDGHWRLTWSLTSGPVELVEMHASRCKQPKYWCWISNMRQTEIQCSQIEMKSIGL